MTGIWSLLGAFVVGVSSWTPANVSQFWVEPNAPASFAFNAVESEPASAPGANGDSSADKEPAEKFVVLTADGAVFAEGVGTRDGDRLRVDATLPQGCFELRFPATDQSFGVASAPAFCSNPEAPEGANGERIRDPFFGIDAAATWLVASDAARDDLIRNARRIGIATIRERTNWAALEPNEGEIDFDGDRRGDVLRRAAIRYRTPILELFHNAPEWAGRLGANYPNDLTKLATSWAKIAERWAPAWNALEVWNEPDISFGGNLPGDQYVPVLQAVAQEYSRRGVSTPIVGGVVAFFRDEWMNCAAENGVLDACDVFSFHTYCRAPEAEGVCRRYFDWLERNDALGKPLWITECGRPWPKGTDRPTREADLESAIDVAQKGVVAKALGIDAYFPFVYPFYEENDNNFGMSDRNNSPLRAIVGYATTIRVLSGKTAIGELDVDSGASGVAAIGADGSNAGKIDAALVFADRNDAENGRVAVLYAKNRAPGRTLKIDGFAPSFVERVAGERLAADAGTVDFSDGFLFVGVPNGAKIALKADSTIDAARERRAAARAAQGIAPRRAPSIVVRFDYDDNKLSTGVGGYNVLDANAKTFDGTLSVFNFDETPRTLDVACVATLGGAAARSGVAVDVERPKTIDVPARGRATVAFSTNVEDVSPLTALKLRFELFESGAVEREKPAGRVAFSLRKEFSVDAFARFAQTEGATPIDLSAVERWRPGCAPCGETRFKTPSELDAGYSWGFDATFGDGDRWAYPVLPFDVDASAFSGVAFRIKATSDDSKATLRFFLYDENAQCYYYTAAGFATADGRERFVALPFSTLGPYGGANGAFDPKRARFFSIGGNATGKDLSIEVGDFYFFP